MIKGLGASILQIPSASHSELRQCKAGSEEHLAVPTGPRTPDWFSPRTPGGMTTGLEQEEACLWGQGRNQKSPKMSRITIKELP